MHPHLSTGRSFRYPKIPFGISQRTLRDNSMERSDHTDALSVHNCVIKLVSSFIHLLYSTVLYSLQLLQSVFDTSGLDFLL